MSATARTISCLVLTLGLPPAWAAAQAADCNSNGVLDQTDIAVGTSQDCNSNTVPDECDIAGGTSPDFNANGVPDECDPDCNLDGWPDFLEIALGFNEDCDGNFEDCLTGPAEIEGYDPPPPACLTVFDFDVDGDVDFMDFVGFATVIEP